MLISLEPISLDHFIHAEIIKI